MKALKAFTKPSESPQSSAKMKISVKFFSSSGSGTLQEGSKYEKLVHTEKHP